MNNIFNEANAAAKLASNYELRGQVNDVTGLVIEGTGPFVPIGSQVSIHSGSEVIPAQVVGFRKDKILLMPYFEPQGISPGAIITATGDSSEVLVSKAICSDRRAASSRRFFIFSIVVTKMILPFFSYVYP